MTVGAHEQSELERIIRAGGKKGEIYAKLKALRDQYAGRDSPGDTRRTFPPCLRLQPRRPSARERVPRRARSPGTEGTCVTVLEACLHLVHSPAVEVSSWYSGYPDVYSAGDPSGRSCNGSPAGSKALTTSLVTDMKKKGIHPQGRHAPSQRGAVGFWSSSAARPRTSRDTKGTRADGTPQVGAQAPLR